MYILRYTYLTMTKDEVFMKIKNILLFIIPFSFINSQAVEGWGSPVDIFTTDEQNSGHSVAFNSNGKVVAIGSPYFDWSSGSNGGSVSVYNLSDGDWKILGASIREVSGKDDSGYDNSYMQHFGHSVSLDSSGTRLAIGTPDASDKYGKVSIYQYNSNSGTWGKLGNHITGKYAGDSTGYSVSLSSNGNRIAIGSPKANEKGEIGWDGYRSDVSIEIGIVRLYEFNSTDSVWTQV